MITQYSNVSKYNDRPVIIIAPEEECLTLVFLLLFLLSALLLSLFLLLEHPH